MRDRAPLWLRLAECSLGAAAAAEAAAEPRTPVARVAGAGPYRRLMLPRAAPRTHVSPGGDPDAALAPNLDACGGVRPLSVEYGLQCLRNAEHLLDAAQPPASAHAAAAAAREAARVRAALLAWRAYAWLLRGAPRPALAAATALLALPPPLAAEAALLARCYAAEALCALDRPAEAVEHLSAALLERDGCDADAAALAARRDADASANADAGDAGDDPGAPAPAGTASLAALRGGAARAALHVNLAAVFAATGEHAAAQQCAASAAAAQPESVHARLAQAFVELARGRPDAAAAILRHARAPPAQPASPPRPPQQRGTAQQGGAAQPTAAGWVAAHPRRGAGGAF
jgi:CCR4-NOT transcription complex subunit 10